MHIPNTLGMSDQLPFVRSGTLSLGKNQWCVAVTSKSDPRKHANENALSYEYHYES